jgi:hypothetical protein
LSLLFGISNKLADGHNEHGLHFFQGAGIVFGLLAGLSGGYLISHSSVLMAAYMAPLFYWIYKRKIDCAPHAVMSLFMLFGAVAGSLKFSIPYSGIIGIFMGLVITDCLKRTLYLTAYRPFFNKRLHFHAVHLIYAILVQNIYGYSALAFGLVGVALAERLAKIPNHPIGTPSPNERA